MHKRIKNKSSFFDQFLFEIELLVEDFNENEIIFQTRALMESFINWEDCFDKIKKAITLKNFYKKYPELKKCEISKDEVERILNEKTPSCFEDYIEGKEDWEFNKSTKERDVNKIFQKAKERILWEEKLNKLKEIKEKYTTEVILDKYSERLKGVENIKEISRHIDILLRYFDQVSEEVLFSQIEQLIDNFVIWEREYNEFVNFNGGEIDKELVSLETMKSLLNVESEKEEFLVNKELTKVSKIKKALKNVLYGKNGKLKPTYNDFSLFIEFTKLRIKEFINCGLLKEVDDKIFIGELASYENVSEKFLKFYAFKDKKTL